jgi:hypothetical protein
VRTVRPYAILLTLALVGGCSNSPAPGNIIPGVSDTSAGGAVVGMGMQGSWMDPRANHSALLYVSDVYMNAVSVFSYPNLEPMGMLTGVSSPQGLCTDPKTGHVWVTEVFKAQIVEFAHGEATPIRTLNDVNEAYVNACAVNPTSGDLAVANSTIQGEDPGNVAIFKHSRGQPTIYSDPKSYTMDFIGYDPAGNLFVDGSTRSRRVGYFRLDELAAGNTQLTNIPWNGPEVRLPGDVRYASTGLLVGNARKHVIYQTSNGTITGTIDLKGACTVYQFTIDRGKLIAPSICTSNGSVLIYNYPAGGKPVAQLTGFVAPFGVTISR